MQYTYRASTHQCMVWWCVRIVCVTHCMVYIYTSLQLTTLLLYASSPQDFTELQCANCGKLITEKWHIFSLSVEGPLASYVNPGGYVHDTLTVREARNVQL